MASFRRLTLAALPFVAGAFFACGSSSSDAPGAVDGGADVASDGGPETKPVASGEQFDVLFVIDDSAGMGDKHELLAKSVGGLLRKVVPTNDVHVGVITTSLGTPGADVCPSTGDTNRLAHLSTRGANGANIANAKDGFLALGPTATTADVDRLIADTESLVRGVGQTGCGFEAQLESAYRFLVQPDPWASVSLGSDNRAVASGSDDVLLMQRKAFLRPTSFVLVLMLTDEDDSTADPFSVGGQGWAFMANQFPGSTQLRADGKSTTAPRATSVCATDPASAACTSCGFAATCNAGDPACQAIKNDSECQKNGGYYGSGEDQLNVRFHRMKERYGIDPQYPVSRYVAGFTSKTVPSRGSEHDASGKYVGTPDCTNPLFAAALPSAGQELCKLTPGTRSEKRVVFGLIGGVPAQLLAGDATNWSAVTVSESSPYDYAAVDPHMLASINPRPGLPAPSAVRGDNGADPINGREWDTKDDDLQYACTYALSTPRTCTVQDPGCMCDSATLNPPVCGATLGEVTRASAYPTTRELRVAHAIGARAVVGSVCDVTSDGYTTTMTRIADKIAAQLAP